MIKKNLLVLLTFFIACSCASFSERSQPIKKRKSHIERIKQCIDDFMTEQGVRMTEAFEVCEKIHRR